MTTSNHLHGTFSRKLLDWQASVAQGIVADNCGQGEFPQPDCAPFAAVIRLGSDEIIGPRL